MVAHVAGFVAPWIESKFASLRFQFTGNNSHDRTIVKKKKKKKHWQKQKFLFQSSPDKVLLVSSIQFHFPEQALLAKFSKEALTAFVGQGGRVLFRKKCPCCISTVFEICGSINFGSSWSPKPKQIGLVLSESQAIVSSKASKIWANWQILKTWINWKQKNWNKPHGPVS